jgi:hypothetical protein
MHFGGQHRARSGVWVQADNNVQEAISDYSDKFGRDAFHDVPGVDLALDKSEVAASAPMRMALCMLG